MLSLVRLVLWVYPIKPSGDDRKNVTLKFVVEIIRAEQAIICDQSSVLVTGSSSVAGAFTPVAFLLSCDALQPTS